MLGKEEMLALARASAMRIVLPRLCYCDFCHAHQTFNNASTVASAISSPSMWVHQISTAQRSSRHNLFIIVFPVRVGSNVQSIIGKKTASLGQSSILFVVIWAPDALPSVEAKPPHFPNENPSFTWPGLCYGGCGDRSCDHPFGWEAPGQSTLAGASS